MQISKRSVGITDSLVKSWVSYPYGTPIGQILGVLPLLDTLGQILGVLPLRDTHWSNLQCPVLPLRDTLVKSWVSTLTGHPLVKSWGVWTP